MVSPANFSISFPEGAASGSNGAWLNLPNYTSPGIYTYEIKETKGNTAGVGYDERTLVLTVYVMRTPGGQLYRQATLHDKGVPQYGKDPKKTDGFRNDFKADKLEVTKKVTGNAGDYNKKFEAKITLFAPAGKDMSKVPIFVNGVKQYFPPGATQLVITRNIKHNETIRITNFPYGVTYTVVETNPGDGYEAPQYSFNDKYKLIGNDRLDKVTITNKKDIKINTGISLDNLPYIIILGAVTIGIIGFTAKRRYSRDDK